MFTPHDTAPLAVDWSSLRPATATAAVRQLEEPYVLMQVAGNAAVAALFLASAGGSLASLFTSFYRVYGALAGACARELRFRA